MMTLQDVLVGYLAYLHPRPSAQRYRSIYRQYFQQEPCALWLSMPAESITRHHILYLKQTHEHTPAQCSKLIGFVKQSYNWAIDRIDPATMQPLYSGHNPAWRVTKHEYIPRDVVMDKEELGRFVRSLETLSPRYQAFFAVRLLAPGRILEVCKMQWKDIDLATGKWSKPTTKTKRPHKTYIPTQAMEYLRRLPQNEAYVFTGQYGHHICSDAPRKVWEKLRVQIGAEHIQLLDFRRTLATYLYSHIKMEDTVAKAVLNHYDPSPQAIYTRLNYDFLAGLIQQYADWVWSHR